MATRKAWWIATLACGTLGAVGAACLVDIPDVVDAASDASTDNGLSDTSLPSCDGACGSPAGFSPVLFALNQSATCPSGMTTLNAAADPGTPGSGACSTCDCTITEPPQCVPVTLTHNFEEFGPPDAAMCAQPGTFTYLNDGGCLVTGDAAVPIDERWAVPPNPPVANGTCTSSSNGTLSMVPSTASRLCLDTSCTSSCTAPNGFEACFVASGAVACPANLTSHHVGTVALSCPTCNGCSVTAAECEGTLALYSDTTCTTLLDTENVDGSCQENSFMSIGELVRSMQYSPALVGTVCKPGTASGSPTVALQQELTVCCP